MTILFFSFYPGVLGRMGQEVERQLKPLLSLSEPRQSSGHIHSWSSDSSDLMSPSVPKYPQHKPPYSQVRILIRMKGVFQICERHGKSFLLLPSLFEVIVSKKIALRLVCSPCWIWYTDQKFACLNVAIPGPCSCHSNDGM